eukprot:Clim_evm114s11 gene=Clim_evmTU114s11
MCKSTEDSRAIVVQFLERIGLEVQNLTPTLKLLEQIVAAAVQKLPFEQLDIALSRGISVERDTIVKKVIEHKRGGYCFELNQLLAWVLQEIGFSVACSKARVVRKGRTQPHTHIIILVDLEDGSRFLVDVAFGAFSPAGPVPFAEFDPTGPNPIGPPMCIGNVRAFRFIQDGHVYEAPGGIRLQSWDADEWANLGEPGLEEVGYEECWKDQYIFHPETPLFAIDIDFANLYTSTHSSCFFTNTRLACRVTEDASTLVLMQNSVTEIKRVHFRDLRQIFPEKDFGRDIEPDHPSPMKRKSVAIPEASLLTALEEHFNINLTWNHATDTVEDPADLRFTDKSKGMKWDV